ncbi:MAG: SdpI family protein [Oscillospiraceae bacterium]|nr:SdpI family protein [Oscillospiraceae bacterium]
MKNKKLLILSSLLILLPIPVGLLLWNHLPAELVTHWGFTGQPDGYMPVLYAVSLPPVLMLLGQWVCIWFTLKDPGNKDRNTKPLTLVLWILPLVSNMVSYTMYALALGYEFSPVVWTLLLMGIMFIAIGNYLPKCKMNYTMGIKVPWAYTSEENWNATHRFGGKVWFFGGFAMLFGAFLPDRWAVGVMLVSTLVLAFIPMLYSYLYYRRQKARGDALLPFPKPVTKGGKISTVFLILILAGTGFLMFSGDLEYRLEEEYFCIEASYYNDLTLFYDVIEAVEYRDGNIPGTRVGGFGSGRLLMGFFRNEEFGTYTRYTYTKPEACVVLTTDREIYVLSGKNAEETLALYQTLQQKTGK